MQRKLEFELPYPVGLSVNHIYRYSNKKCFLTQRAKNYKDLVYYLLRNKEPFENVKLSLNIDMHPPDDRKRDIDNILKLILDSLEYAKIIDNDCNIFSLCIAKKESTKEGLLKIRIAELNLG